MVYTDGAEYLEPPKIIFVRSIVSVPRNNIEGRVVILEREELPLEFIYDSPFL